MKTYFIFCSMLASTALMLNLHGAEKPPKPNPHMQKVLDQLQQPGGKSIETLTLEEARQQSTPADAVKALLTKEGKSAAPEPVAACET